MTLRPRFFFSHPYPKAPSAAPCHLQRKGVPGICRRADAAAFHEQRQVRRDHGREQVAHEVHDDFHPGQPFYVRHDLGKGRPVAVLLAFHHGNARQQAQHEDQRYEPHAVAKETEVPVYGRQLTPDEYHHGHAYGAGGHVPAHHVLPHPAFVKARDDGVAGGKRQPRPHAQDHPTGQYAVERGDEQGGHAAYHEQAQAYDDKRPRVDPHRKPAVQNRNDANRYAGKRDQKLHRGNRNVWIRCRYGSDRRRNARRSGILQSNGKHGNRQNIGVHFRVVFFHSSHFIRIGRRLPDNRLARSTDGCPMSVMRSCPAPARRARPAGGGPTPRTAGAGKSHRAWSRGRPIA